MALVFDIETVGTPFDQLPESAQEFLLRYCETPGAQEEEKGRTGLSPFTAQIVCVAFHHVEKDKGVVVARCGSQAAPAGDGLAWISAADERELLERFWSTVSRRPDETGGRDSRLPFVTFNGRSFDVPFLLVRSGILGVKPSRDILGNRYRGDVHVDLMDQLKFQGAARWRVNLDLACRMFGIESPKTAEMHGNMVQSMWAEGRGADIARYCHGDVRATAELYRRWRDSMNP
ncbi:MAG: ribonuclease H-like domain-containing protein [Candidatus Eisenbacteria bacterium]|nr:ribonuclease H-like domain-containing protein [Candidatus Eisenbacteria bacterium]